MRDGVTLSLRLPTKKLRDDLKRIAAREQRSLNRIIVKACEEFVRRASEGDKS